ncbi:Na(+)/citrate cotransporter isoform X2 [Dermatophagoides farinae]|uniref:Na(+)/citrate cotransporter isoform X2 n=1 Tax=Dermatophagoides farinae TaxID=6954 RepID=UPI003F629FEE
MLPNILVRCKDGLILLLTPLLLSPLLWLNYHSTESRCAFVVLLMIIYWIFQPIPLAVTALIPVALFPLFGLATTEKACEPYLKSTNMLFMASLIIAIAMEKSGFHKRIAFRVLIFIGNDLRSIFAGFMFVTMFLGIWIINTAATAMILPIADVVVNEIFNNYRDKNPELEMINGNPTIEIQRSDVIRKYSKKISPELDYIRRLLYICIAFSATIGGTSTLTSNGPNLVFQFVLDQFYGNVPDVDYTKWLLFCLPATILSVFLCWCYITMIYLKINAQVKNTSTTALMQKYNELGSITFHEIAVCITFVVLIILWMFRDPQFLTGWARMLGHDIIPKDTTPAILMVILLFCIPSNPFGPFPSESLLDWKFAQSKLAWGVILLRGGGFAMADAAMSSGLTRLIGEQLVKINELPFWSIVVIISLTASFTTELASNSAIASVFLPISGQIALFLNKNPLFFIIPVTLSCSYAFVLPVGTPANALVASHAKLKPFDTVLPGFVTKMICITIMFCNLFILGVPMFSLDSLPMWANTTSLETI